MPRVWCGFRPACFALLAALAAAPLGNAATQPRVDASSVQLDSLRHQCIAAAQDVQHQERAIGALDVAIRAMTINAEAEKKELASSREKEEALLGALERLAVEPAGIAIAPEGALDRQRSAILIRAAVPTLAAKIHDLRGRLATLYALQARINVHGQSLDDARAALAQGSQALAQLVARRNALDSLLLHDDGTAMQASLDDQAHDVSDLIKKADAAMDQRDQELLLRLKPPRPRAGKPPANLPDPTKPKALRELDAPQAQMVWPIAGEPVHRFREPDPIGKPGQGLTMQGFPSGVVVAPFDGKVDYAGPYRSYGLILIIRHAGGYHSLLAGLGRVDVTAGQWVLAGEPVGSLPDDDGNRAGAAFNMELRHDGRPVDPQPWLAGRDQKTEETRVRE